MSRERQLLERWVGNNGFAEYYSLKEETETFLKQPEQEPISDDYTKLKEDYTYYISQKSPKREPLSDVNILCLNLALVAIVLWFC